MAYSYSLETVKCLVLSVNTNVLPLTNVRSPPSQYCDKWWNLRILVLYMQTRFGAPISHGVRQMKKWRQHVGSSLSWWQAIWHQAGDGRDILYVLTWSNVDGDESDYGTLKNTIKLGVLSDLFWGWGDEKVWGERSGGACIYSIV